MKHFYLELEEQGTLNRILDIVADDEDEAIEKAKDYIFNEFTSFFVDKKDAEEDMNENCIYDMEEVE